MKILTFGIWGEGSIYPILFILSTRAHYYQEKMVSKLHQHTSQNDRYVLYKVNQKFENRYIGYMETIDLISPVAPVHIIARKIFPVNFVKTFDMLIFSQPQTLKFYAGIQGLEKLQFDFDVEGVYFEYTIFAKFYYDIFT